MIQPAVQPAPAAMKPRQPAIGMPQGPQGGRDAGDGGQMRLGDRLVSLGQRLCRPG